MNAWPAIVSVPVRAPPVLAATLYVTVPGPVTELPPITVSQLTLLCAVQLQPAVALTVTQFDPPNAEINALVGLSEAPQVGAAACVTVKVCPPTLIEAVREVVALLAATLNDTVPLPVPLGAPLRVSQLALLVALHAHPAPAVTLKELAPPPAAAA